MKTLWKGFPYGSADREAAEEWLNELGRQGWRLEKVRLGVLAVFVQSGEPCTYCVCTQPGSFYGRGRAEYEQLCWDGGWQWTANVRSMDIFVSRPGHTPVPLITDPEVERREEARRKRRGRVFLAVLLAPLLAAIAWSFRPGGRPWHAILESNRLLACLLALALCGLIPAGAAVWRKLRPPRPRSGRAVRRRAALWLAVLPLWYVLCFGLAFTEGLAEIVAWVDAPPAARALGVDAPGDMAYRQVRASVLVEGEHYSQPLVGADHTEYGSVKLDRYRCRGEGTARLLAELVRLDETRGSPGHLDGTHGPLTGAEVPVEGIAWAWHGRGEGRTCLILRYGEGVAVAETDQSVPPPDHQTWAALRALLEEWP